MMKLFCIAVLLSWMAQNVSAAGVGRSLAHRAIRGSLRRLPRNWTKVRTLRFRSPELRRDLRTPARALPARRAVRRYTSRSKPDGRCAKVSPRTAT
jgi:hypothetical protein